MKAELGRQEDILPPLGVAFEPGADDNLRVVIDVSRVPVGATELPGPVEDGLAFLIRAGVALVLLRETGTAGLFATVPSMSVHMAQVHQAETHGADSRAILAELSKGELHGGCHRDGIFRWDCEKEEVRAVSSECLTSCKVCPSRQPLYPWTLGCQGDILRGSWLVGLTFIIKAAVMRAVRPKRPHVEPKSAKVRHRAHRTVLAHALFGQISSFQVARILV